jgi:amino acid transporter
MYLTMAYVVVMAFRGSGRDLGSNLSPFDYVAAAAGWPRLSLIVAIGITLSFAACMLGCTNAAARILFALARRGHFWSRFGAVHPVNATPYRALGLAGLVILVLALVPLALGLSLDNCMAYGAQVASTGFVSTYILVSVAAPFFLHRVGALRWYHVAMAISAVVIFGCALVASIYPAPPSPWNLLPYIFIAAVAVGVGASWLHGRGRVGATAPHAGGSAEA